jgi:RNA polymerase sigma-70 factor, ECF subfamily
LSGVNPPPSTDADDWAGALVGDGEAFARVFDRHQQRIYQHSLRLVRTPDDAKDIVGITFLQAWRKRRSVRFVGGSLLPWLLVTATHTSRNLARSSRRYRALLDRVPPAPPAPDPADIVDAGPAIAALRSLSRAHQEVVALCVLQGFTVLEAAEALGIPEGTVKSRLHWAKRRLADRLTVPDPAVFTAAERIA